MAIVFVSIDLAKNVFAVHGVNEAGRAEGVKPAVRRGHGKAVVSIAAKNAHGLGRVATW